jgi:hypothetical protein
MIDSQVTPFNEDILLKNAGVELTKCLGTDGIAVIFVDTPGLPEDASGPLCRIYLNDEVIYENPSYPGVPNAGAD